MLAAAVALLLLSGARMIGEINVDVTRHLLPKRNRAHTCPKHSLIPFWREWLVGCCWALFAVLIVAGNMGLAWMLLLTLAVLVEKVLSQGQRISTAIGVAFVALGLAVSIGAVPTPWLQ